LANTCRKKENVFYERIVVPEKAAKELGDSRNVIFQDHQDYKQRMRLALYTVNYVFINQIEPINCDAKIADAWPIENL
jgi:hypothetical protein